MASPLLRRLVLVVVSWRPVRIFDVVVFPKGTRSPRDDSLHPLPGTFERAARTNLPIVLMKLADVPPAMFRGLPIWKVPDAQRCP